MRHGRRRIGQPGQQAARTLLCIALVIAATYKHLDEILPLRFTVVCAVRIQVGLQIGICGRRWFGQVGVETRSFWRRRRRMIRSSLSRPSASASWYRTSSLTYS